MDCESVRKPTLVQIKAFARILRDDAKIANEWPNGFSPQDLKDACDVLLQASSLLVQEVY